MTIQCGPLVADTFRCPTKFELFRQVLALLPRGRAWQTHEDVHEIAHSQSSEVERFEADTTALGAEPYAERLTTLQRYWLAYAEVLEYLHQRACALLDEMFCATTAELRAEWGHEYGFPDSCEPWDSLCLKVRADGGATCAYLASLATRLGWFLECSDCMPSAGVDCIAADGLPSCECEPNVIYIKVWRSLSPSWMEPVPFNADAAVADCTPPCAAAPDAVVCLVERYKPAHVRAIYEVI